MGHRSTKSSRRASTGGSDTLPTGYRLHPPPASTQLAHQQPLPTKPTKEKLLLDQKNTRGMEDSSTIERGQSSHMSDERDEVHEVRKAASRDTFNVVIWRNIVTGFLLGTAIAVTLTIYLLLRTQYIESFEKQYEQFARAVASAALEQQTKAHLAYRGFADTLTAIAQISEAEFPFVELPLFEKLAANTIKQSDTEIAIWLPLVRENQTEEWIEFANDTHEEMVAEAHLLRYGSLKNLTAESYHPYLTKGSNTTRDDVVRDVAFPVMNFAPAPRNYGIINWNAYADDIYHDLLNDMLELKTESLTTTVKPYSVADGLAFTKEQHAAMHEHVNLKNSDTDNPHSFLFTPVYERLDEPDSPIVGVILAGFAWDKFMSDLLPEDVEAITVVLDDNQGKTWTYTINGPKVEFVGAGDHHETKFDDMVHTQDLTEGLNSQRINEFDGHSKFSVRVYPTSPFEDSMDPIIPEITAVIVATAFVIVTFLFHIYDSFVQVRNEKLVANAAKSNAIVSSIFPSTIRDRLINAEEGSSSPKVNPKNLKHFMSGIGDPSDPLKMKPLADLFLECTVSFADIAGFTAWSSVREPTQVFTILEHVFHDFDKLAKKRKVFKVETVGDSYVSATGIPDYTKDHGVRMVRFARDILARFNTLTKQLERTLGPDTDDLSLRIGIHTGPVTAGVLRGDRARFQLFGDTVNVCSRVERSSMPGRIHISAQTAENLRENGKAHWLIKRDDHVAGTGKGEIQTFWIGIGVENEKGDGSNASDSGEFFTAEPEHRNAVYEPVDHDRTGEEINARIARLVDWNVKVLSQSLKLIVARRSAKLADTPESARRFLMCLRENGIEKRFLPLEEVEEIIHLPEFDARAAKRQEDPELVMLPDSVTEQLRQYVANIASMYRDNAFHNFEHASHVTMSVIKLLARIVAPSELMEENEEDGNDESMHETLHDHTYGITSDPLTQFSCAFAAMIHDVDHTGVPNAQLVKEGCILAQVYGERSVAEQNSLVLAWDMLMQSDYDDLRSTLCANQSELNRFRQLVVNSVMATDIVDKDLKALRNARWDKAFKDIGESEDNRAAVNRKATIVIEHLIQASDVAHTMQHWHVYRKWNENFFRECYMAYLDGRAEKDPSDSWYRGELGFFDFYIIPLAKKLKECGVFGKSSDEYLTYALANRNEWESRGEEVVADMLAAIDQERAYAC